MTTKDISQFITRIKVSETQSYVAPFIQWMKNDSEGLVDRMTLWLEYSPTMPPPKAITRWSMRNQIDPHQTRDDFMRLPVMTFPGGCSLYCAKATRCVTPDVEMTIGVAPFYNGCLWTTMPIPV